MFGADLTSCLFHADQARAQLTVFETRDATPEEMAAASEHKREEERQLLVAQHAKKVRNLTFTRLSSQFFLKSEIKLLLAGAPLIPRGKRLTVSLPVRKKQRIGEQPNKTGASAPSPVREERTGRLAFRLSESRSSWERTPTCPRPPTISKAARTMTPVAGSTSSLSTQPLASFMKADPDVRLSLVQDIVKSWDLATPRALEPPKVSKEEMAVGEVFAQGVKAVAECPRLEGLASRYQRCYEKLQAGLEGREKDMQC